MKLLQRPQSLQESNASASASGSNPPPRQITIARKPPVTVQETDQQAQPVMMVLHKSSNEYDAATYATPTSNQTVKILRRPAQAEERRDTNGVRPKQPIKTLKQREQEYAEARLRILGAAKNPEDDKPLVTLDSYCSCYKLYFTFHFIDHIFGLNFGSETISKPNNSPDKYKIFRFLQRKSHLIDI